MALARHVHLQQTPNGTRFPRDRVKSPASFHFGRGFDSRGDLYVLLLTLSTPATIWLSIALIHVTVQTVVI